MGSKKGGSFERRIAPKLSMWWTHGERDDIFWRTAGSGARAKVRSHKNKKTFGQTGDIQAVDPIGSPFIELCNLELKIGYNKWSILDILDKPKRSVKQTLEQFLEKTEMDAAIAGSPFPCLIAGRDRRQVLMFIPHKLYCMIRDRVGQPPLTDGVDAVVLSWNGHMYTGMRLEDWFQWVTPECILDIYKSWKENKDKAPIVKRTVVRRVVRVKGS